MQNENYKEKRYKRLTEDLKEWNSEERDKLLDFLLGVEEDASAKRKEEIEIHLLEKYTDEAKEITKNWGKVTGIGSGYNAVDALTKGFDPGNLIVMAGRTSQYKTMLSINMARNIAKAGTPVMFVSLENTKAEIAARLMKICFDDEEYHDVASRIAVQAKDELDWRSIDALVESFVELFNGEGIVFIDHLHYFTRDTQNTAEALGAVTKELKKNAIRHKVPIVLISHVRKAMSEREKNKLPSSEDLRGSSLIAQDADIVLIVGNGLAVNRGKEIVVVEIEKNRNKGFDPEANRAYLIKDPNGVRIFDN